MVSLKELSLRALCNALDSNAVLPPLAPQELTAIKNAANAFLRTLGLPESQNPLGSLRQIRRQALLDMRSLKAESLELLPLAEVLPFLEKSLAKRNLIYLFRAVHKSLEIPLTPLDGTLEEQAESARQWMERNRNSPAFLTVESLDFSHAHLTEPPKELLLFPNVTKLNFSNTPIRAFPLNCKPPRLQHLILGSTPLAHQFLGIQGNPLVPDIQRNLPPHACQFHGEAIPLFFELIDRR